MSNNKEVTLVECSLTLKLDENKLNYQNDVIYVPNILMENDFSYIDDDDDDCDGDVDDKIALKNIAEENQTNIKNKTIIEKNQNNVNNIEINTTSKVNNAITTKGYMQQINTVEPINTEKETSQKSPINGLKRNEKPSEVSDWLQIHKNLSATENQTITNYYLPKNSKTNMEMEDDPYIELQEYLEKVKREINDVFEEYKNKNSELLSNEIGNDPIQLVKNNMCEGNLESTDTITYKKEATKRHSKNNDVKLEVKLDQNKATKDVNKWANKIIRELDNLVASNEEANNKLKKIQNIQTIVRPEKHATIPLQSFNLEERLTPNKPKIMYMDYLYKDAITTNDNQRNNNTNPDKIETVLKIEECTDAKSKCLLNLSLTQQGKIKKEKCLQSFTSFPSSGEFSKKDSSSTIWTSEESILRNVAQFDDYTKSTSSLEEASGLFSSGKSGNSLDSSELDNEQVESGIGTATPPKESFSSAASFKLKFNKNNSVQSPDDSDLLDENDDIQNLKNIDCVDIAMNGEYDHEVVLRKKNDSSKLNENHRHAISMPFNRSLKTRSHYIEPSKFCFASSQKELKCSGSKEFIDLNRSMEHDNFENSVSSNIQELPSHSSASLHSGNDNIGMEMIELTTKSNSAPLLVKKIKKQDEFHFGQKQNSLRYSRSQSDRYLAEIEAIEACKWLRAAGFPQYAQMYEDLQFPIDLSNVAKDHPILENDPLQSLYRRLCILNRCAALRLDNAHRHHQEPQKDDSDDEGFALSDNWKFQPQSRRWSRIGEMGLELQTKQNVHDKPDCSSKESSPERCDEDSKLLDFLTLPQNSSDSSKTDSDSMTRLRRTGSERLKDGAKAFLRRVESIKSRRRKRQNRDGIIMCSGSNGEVSGKSSNTQPILNLENIENMRTNDKFGINIVFSIPPSPSALSPVHFFPRNIIDNDLKVPGDSLTTFLHPNRLSPKHIPTTPRSCHSMRTSPLHFFKSPMPHLREGKSDESSSYLSDSQDSCVGDKLGEMKKISSRSRRFLQRSGKVDDIGAHSDSECHAGNGRKFIFKDSSSTEQEGNGKKLTRGGSLNLRKDSKKYRDKFHNRSFRAGTTTLKKSKDGEEPKSKKIPVVRWHSFQNNEKPQLIFKKCFTETTDSKEKEQGTSFAAMSCGQLQVVKKIALVTLTGYMERYCPSHRTGWNWDLPKFIKKIKTPDYKDKKVFGVPLLLVLQRTGKSLPIGITAAIRWLQLNALDQIGIFRKSGVKSRILKLKETIETLQSYEDCMDMFDNHQAFDVADMLKQYFRDLPDSLLTAKMSETFVAIFQHLPNDVRIDAVQAAILLLPDENRDVLYALLAFLNEVGRKSQLNQMTASNLAVCLAPSLFNSSIATGNPVAVSPRRRKAGQPSMKELSETKASHECLAIMIDQYNKIFTATPEKIIRCNFGYMEDSNPVTLEALGEGMPFQNWRGYLYECTSATMKEGREKTRGWIAINSLDSNIEIAYKKVGDGHLLRLWRCLTEVEGPPGDVLNFILNERSIWDCNLIKSQLIKELDERAEIIQYVIDGQIPTSFCVLRSWQINLPKQACVIVETSINHRDAKPMEGSIVGVVLASRYLIEPCGSGRSRVMHLSRVDLKGKTPEWYNKNYGHICSQYLSKIRLAFRHVAEGPESKV